MPWDCLYNKHSLKQTKNLLLYYYFISHFTRTFKDDIDGSETRKHKQFWDYVALKTEWRKTCEHICYMNLWHVSLDAIWSQRWLMEWIEIYLEGWIRQIIQDLVCKWHQVGIFKKNNNSKYNSFLNYLRKPILQSQGRNWTSLRL